MDEEMARWAKRKMEEAGIRIQTGVRAEAILGADKVSALKTDKLEIKADMVILALGVRPSTKFLENTGLEMEKGAILVDEHMRTNIPDVYAAGDCALVSHRITGKRLYSAMGSTANISARVLAKNVVGKDSVYPGALGTGVVRLLDNLNAGRTGLTEEAAVKEGFDVVTALAVTDDKAHYYEGSSFFIMKLIAERKTHRKPPVPYGMDDFRSSKKKD